MQALKKRTALTPFPNLPPVSLADADAASQQVDPNMPTNEPILTFLGVGVQNGASWGTMVADAPGELVNGIWWPLTGVTVAMFVILYALNVVGDALRDALDPKLVD